VYDRYHARIYYYNLRFLYQEELAEEATADVFIQLWKKRSMLNPEGIILPFLYKLAKDISINYLKKIASSERLKQEYIEHFLLFKEDTQEDKLIKLEEWENLISQIELLPPKRKEILKLRYQEGLDYKSIAQKLNISPHTVKVQLVKARKFLKYKRELPETKLPKERVKNYKEFHKEFEIEKTQNQAARCMDCGVPFCHNGCPLGNIIPEFNDAVHRGEWLEAFQILSETNNFPEFTGRICPAPCEKSCVLGINNPPVAIEHIEKTIAEIAFEQGYVRPQPPAMRTGKRIAIIGSGPAGLAAAAQLNKVGHFVTVFERDDRVGGLLRYGIPDFKLEKWVLERRIAIMEAEGIRFQTNTNVGVNIAIEEILERFDSIILAGGSTVPRDLMIEGRDLKGVHFAMAFLKQNNQRVAGDVFPTEEEILATNKNVVVIGGGDTGSDCVGTSNRQGASSVTQLELLFQPPVERAADTPWPLWPLELRTSSSHEEGCERNWSVLTKAFVADKKGNLKALKIANIEWKTPKKGERPTFVEIEGTEREIPCELAFLAVGFINPQYKGMLEQLGVELDARGNVKAENYQTNHKKIFVAGDMRRGQSLVVWAISEGREAAKAVDTFLMEESLLKSKTVSAFEVLI